MGGRNEISFSGAKYFRRNRNPLIWSYCCTARNCQSWADSTLKDDPKRDTWNLSIPAVIVNLNGQTNISAENTDKYLEPWLFYISSQ
jgi:hypothetical protein